MSRGRTGSSCISGIEDNCSFLTNWALQMNIPSHILNAINELKLAVENMERLQLHLVANISSSETAGAGLPAEPSRPHQQRYSHSHSLSLSSPSSSTPGSGQAMLTGKLLIDDGSDKDMVIV